MKFTTQPPQTPDIYDLKEYRAKLNSTLETYMNKKDDGRISKETKIHYQNLIDETMARIDKVEASINKICNI